MTELSRRKLLAASAWAVPVVAVTVATPLVAASTVPGFDLSVPEMVGAGAPAAVVVTISPALLPLAEDAVRLRLTRTSGNGVLAGVPPTDGWRLAYIFTNRAELYNMDSAPTVTTFGLTFTGPSTWSVELITPDGTLTRTLQVVS